MRQLGVAIRDVSGFLRERLDHIAQSGKALVYGLRLLQPIARAARPSNPLGASQVDQVQLSRASQIIAGVAYHNHIGSVVAGNTKAVF